jgi:hypothetical protein
MKELKEFVARENRFDAIFGKPGLDLANAADRQRIASKIDSCLSPENLSCDGEVRGAQLQAKARFLNRAAEQLMRLDPSVEIHEFY